MSDQPPEKQYRDFARYSGLAFQMMVSIGLFTFAGYKIDQYRGSKELLFTALLGLLGVLVALIQVVRALKS